MELFFRSVHGLRITVSSLRAWLLPTRGLLPVTVIEKDLSNRMASTIRHNRARGTHNVELMSEIVAELTRARMSDQWIMRHIGMDRDELLRLKQITGLADLFADKEFSLGDTDEDSVEEMLEV